MDIQEFALGDSFVHRLDPRVKIAATLILSVIIALNKSIMASAVALIFPILLILLARISLTRVLARLAVVNTFTLFLWFFLPFTWHGDGIYRLGPLVVDHDGLFQAVLISLKTNVIVLIGLSLLGTSSIFALVHALSHMGVPDKLVNLFFFCFRYVHVIHEEYHRLIKAMKIRGFKPSTNIHTYRAYAYLFGILLVKSFDRSCRILAAMKCRGFKGQFYILHDYEMKKCDYVMAISSLLLSGAVLVIR